jgi:hypothetical protein
MLAAAQNSQRPKFGCSKFEGLKACGKILWLDSKTNLFIYLDNLFF